MLTKKQFLSYETVRKSAITNMFDVRMVEKLSELSKATIIDIMKNYSKYKQLYDKETK